MELYIYNYFVLINESVPTYTVWKGNKCHPFNIRRGRLKETKNLYIIWGLNLIVFSEKGVNLFCFVHVVLLTSLEIMRKKITSVDLPYKDVILFSKNILRVRCSLRKIK